MLRCGPCGLNPNRQPQCVHFACPRLKLDVSALAITRHVLAKTFPVLRQPIGTSHLNGCRSPLSPRGEGLGRTCSANRTRKWPLAKPRETKKQALGLVGSDRRHSPIRSLDWFLVACPDTRSGQKANRRSFNPNRVAYADVTFG